MKESCLILYKTKIYTNCNVKHKNKAIIVCMSTSELYKSGMNKRNIIVRFFSFNDRMKDRHIWSYQGFFDTLTEFLFAN